MGIPGAADAVRAAFPSLCISHLPLAAGVVTGHNERTIEYFPVEHPTPTELA